MKRKLAVATATVISLAFPTAIANAAPSPVTGVELVKPTDQFVHTNVTVNLNDGNTIGIPELKKLRGWAWDQNPLFRGFDHEGFGRGTRLQEVARHYGIDTKAQYQQIYGDTDLHWIAVQRAMEASELFAHQRPDNSSRYTATRGNIAPEGESLAAGLTLKKAISEGWGRGEVRNLQNNGGVWSDKKHDMTGHAIHILHPNHNVWGFAQVTVPGTANQGRYAVAINGNIHPNNVNNAPMENHRQNIQMDRAAKSNESPGTVTNARAIGGGNSGGGAVSSSGDIISIIGVILGAVSILGSIWAMIQQFLPR